MITDKILLHELPKKGKAEFIYRCIDGLWRNVSSQIPELLSDKLKELGLTIDDRTQFARFYDWENKIIIEYRAYNLAKVVITIYPLENE